jgi:8-oxo-dGTP pyrophosphatase MutT (NUDIX family)
MKKDDQGKERRMAGPSNSDLHKNDIYGDLDKDSGNPAIPAATVVLLRDIDSDGRPEVLMLRKNSKIAFGGMWVFPGGRIDEEDYDAKRDLETAARNAAAREAREEAGIQAEPGDFVWFAHWSPPPSTKRRFATWFFAVQADDQEIEIDGGEIMEHSWVNPGLALERHRAGEIDLAPPTWVTLYHLSRYTPSSDVLAHLAARSPGIYETHVVERSDGVRVALWKGDSGYEAWDADLPGARHRLILARDGFVFEHPDDHY